MIRRLLPDGPAGRGSRRAGLTLIELMVCVAVLGVLAGVAMPLVQVSIRRTHELELRRSLRQLRDGLDRFKAEYDKAKGNAQDAQQRFRRLLSADRTGYPLTLQEMVDTKILRRIPKDPMTGEANWVTRSYSDNPDSSLSDGKDVWDLRSASKAVSSDGTTYDTW
jgi:general secretion pathway protein G